MKNFLLKSAQWGPKANLGSDSLRDIRKERLLLLALAGVALGTIEAQELVMVVLSLWLLLTEAPADPPAR